MPPGTCPGAPEPSEYGFDYYRCHQANGPCFEQEGKPPYFRARSTTLFVDETIQSIERNLRSPFHKNLWTLEPHATLYPTLEQLRPYAFLKPGRNLPNYAAPQIY